MESKGKISFCKPKNIDFENQRRLETRVKKYSKIMDTINNETKIAITKIVLII